MDFKTLEPCNMGLFGSLTAVTVPDFLDLKATQLYLHVYRYIYICNNYFNDSLIEKKGNNSSFFFK